MSHKSLIAAGFLASLMSASALVAPAEALTMPHPRPIGHHALPYRHGHISVANLPGHRPAYHHRRHRLHAKPHHPVHAAKPVKHDGGSTEQPKTPGDQKPADDKGKTPT